VNKALFMTEQRQVILDELGKSKAHPTADEVFQLVRKRMPRISLGTVYRNLERLAESGLIQKMEVAGSQRRFDGTTSDHYHVRCVRCGRIEDARIDPIPDLTSALGKMRGYQVVGHRLEFMVVCPSCRQASGSAKS
jgi:Fur family transcriptional regulator, ferric uptake regulator